MSKTNAKRANPMFPSKTDKRLLNEKLQAWRDHVDKTIDRVYEFPPNYLPARNRDAIIRKHTRTLRYLNHLINTLNQSEI